MPTCIDCIWLSTGFQDARGAGWCYSENDYVDADGTCAFWQESLRDEKVQKPELREPTP